MKRIKVYWTMSSPLKDIQAYIYTLQPSVGQWSVCQCGAVKKLGQTSALTKLGLLSDHWIAELWQCDYSVVRPSFGIDLHQI